MAGSSSDSDSSERGRRRPVPQPPLAVLVVWMCASCAAYDVLPVKLAKCTSGFSLKQCEVTGVANKGGKFNGGIMNLRCGDKTYVAKYPTDKTKDLSRMGVFKLPDSEHLAAVEAVLKTPMPARTKRADGPTPPAESPTVPGGPTDGADTDTTLLRQQRRGMQPPPPQQQGGVIRGDTTQQQQHPLLLRRTAAQQLQLHQPQPQPQPLQSSLQSQSPLHSPSQSSSQPSQSLQQPSQSSQQQGGAPEADEAPSYIRGVLPITSVCHADITITIMPPAVPVQDFGLCCALQVGVGLRDLHHVGAVHNDLKEDNVMMHDNKCKLIDHDSICSSKKKVSTAVRQSAIQTHVRKLVCGESSYPPHEAGTEAGDFHAFKTLVAPLGMCGGSDSLVRCLRDLNSEAVRQNLNCDD